MHITRCAARVNCGKLSHRYPGLGGYSFEGVVGFIPRHMPGAVNPPQTPRRVSRSGFHAWLQRPPSKHPQEGERLKVAIRAAHVKPGGAMALKDCTKSYKTKALLSDTTGWHDYGGRWAGMEKRGGVRMIY